MKVREVFLSNSNHIHVKLENVLIKFESILLVFNVYLFMKPRTSNYLNTYLWSYSEFTNITLKPWLAEQLENCSKRIIWSCPGAGITKTCGFLIFFVYFFFPVAKILNLFMLVKGLWEGQLRSRDGKNRVRVWPFQFWTRMTILLLECG